MAQDRLDWSVLCQEPTIGRGAPMAKSTRSVITAEAD
jgi:hypothetical protein